MRKKLPALYFGGFLAALAAILTLRFVLLAGYVDPNSGFYIGGEGIVLALHVVAAAAAVFLFSALFAVPRETEPLPLPAGDTARGVWSAVCAAGLFYAGAAQIFRLIDPALKAGGGAFFDGVCAFLAALFFAKLSRDSLQGRTVPMAMGALLPVLWATVHLIATWTRYTVIVSVSAYLFDLLKMVSFMLFFYYFARWVGGVPNGKERAGLFSFGLLSVLFGLCSALPALVAQTRSATAPGPGIADSIATLAFCLFIASLLLRLFVPAAARREARG